MKQGEERPHPQTIHEMELIVGREYDCWDIREGYIRAKYLGDGKFEHWRVKLGYVFTDTVLHWNEHEKHGTCCPIQLVPED